MENLELVYGGECESKIEEMEGYLQQVNCAIPSELARLLVSLEALHPGPNLNRQAFVSTAVKLVNQYGVGALTTIAEFWKEAVAGTDVVTGR